MRARDLGIAIGQGTPGPKNAITDVAGVRVDVTTLIEREDVRTGVTVIVPPDEPLFAGCHRLNGNGEDVQIASTAWALGVPVATENFADLPGLSEHLAELYPRAKPLEVLPSPL